MKKLILALMGATCLIRVAREVADPVVFFTVVFLATWLLSFDFGASFLCYFSSEDD